jgi:hypothetical protein
MLAALVLLAFAPFSTRAAAPAGHYVVSGSGAAATVYDTKSGLTWQKTLSLGTWAEAKANCARAGERLGGTGWRLPTFKELLTLLDLSQTGTTANDFKIDAVFGPVGQTGYWSATLEAGRPDRAWNVNFFYGDTYSYPITNQNVARCVR